MTTRKKENKKPENKFFGRKVSKKDLTLNRRNKTKAKTLNRRLTRTSLSKAARGRGRANTNRTPYTD